MNRVVTISSLFLLSFLLSPTSQAQPSAYSVTGAPDASGIYLPAGFFNGKPYFKVDQEELYLFYCPGPFPYDQARCGEDIWLIGTELPVSGKTSVRTALYYALAEGDEPSPGLYTPAFGVAGEPVVVRQDESNRTVGAERAGDVPAVFSVAPAYPNPFNPTATIRFSVPASRFVRVDLHDALGRPVKPLHNGIAARGVTELHIDGSNLPSGTYFVRFTGDEVRAVQQVVLAK